MPVTKYGLLSYKGWNIGDDIQSLAAKRFLPRVDYSIMRDTSVIQLGNDESVSMILNAFWGSSTGLFVSTPSIKPLLVSMHWDNSAFRSLSKYNALNFLQKLGSVGCRDKVTL
ncbi:hypothetical protein AGMMS49992_30290 [Clostridia bacterium]|nr:hypothetical protein AGMMS49992_30290 [Clostridia bacterium]